MNGNIYTQIGILFILKNSEILTFETIWMNLESIMLSEASQAQKARHRSLHDLTSMWNLKQPKS